MASFKLYDCDFGVTINGTNYDFDHVDSVAIEDPRSKRLTRGANAKNKLGLVHSEGMKDPDRWTVMIMDMSIEIFGVLTAAFEGETRMTVYAIDRKTGSTKSARNAILCQQPQQLNLEEGPESLQVQLIFDSFDASEDHKEA